MVIVIFGESCTGKSTIAEALVNRISAEVYTGNDYLRLSKSKDNAEKLFVELLAEYSTKKEHLIYVVSEKEHLRLIPDNSIRILVTADIDVIKERFAKRMNGKLPAPVSKMLDNKHGMFDDEKHDMHIYDGQKSIDSVCDEILSCISLRA